MAAHAIRNKAGSIITWVRSLKVPVFILLCFAIAVFALGSDWANRDGIAKVFMGIVAFTFAIWFILVFAVKFSQNAEECRNQMTAHFQFAYLFTLVCFALLTLPFTLLVDEQVESDAAPIKLIRGCIKSNFVDRSGKERVIPYCDIAPVVAVSTTAESIQPGTASSTTASVRAAAARVRSYPWMLSIGGVKGASREMDTHRPGEVKPNERRYYYEIESGFYVPLYVVLLAFIGGAVSLSRRIPEYQKRTDPDYIESSSEFAFKPYQAREAVVFQIMQLVSAPFIAITVFFAIEPETIASAVALAFASGFASETILLMIRGMVEGIRPQASLLQKPNAGALKVYVSHGGKDVAGAKIYLNGDAHVRALTDKDGWAQLPRVPVGPHRVTAEFGGAHKEEDVTIPPDQTVEVRIAL